MIKPNQKQNTGFTLIEIMTAVSIFAIIMTISMGSIIGIFNANKKSESLKSIMDNLNLSVESMSREMRFGSYYSCNPTLVAPNPPLRANCLSGGHSIAFRSNDGMKTIVYRQTGTRIEKSSDGGVNFLPMTAPEITVSDLTFYVLGTTAYPDTEQPRVLIKIKGVAGSAPKATSDFTVQTYVSQRQLDN